MSATTRKQRQRQREREAGMIEVRFKITAHVKAELDKMLEVRELDAAEFFAYVAYRDASQFNEMIENLGSCEFCGEKLPQGCANDVHKGRGECWKTHEKREAFKLG